jgi:hypothetical protein
LAYKKTNTVALGETAGMGFFRINLKTGARGLPRFVRKSHTPQTPFGPKVRATPTIGIFALAATQKSAITIAL